MRVIAGAARGHRLQGPRGRSARPTADRVKESLFDILSGMLAADIARAAVLDLYAGTGALGIEALSRGAASALFVDRDPALARLIWQNLRLTGFAASAEVWPVEVRTARARLRRAERRFDVVLADPPYHRGHATWLVASVGDLVAAGGLLAVEHGAREELPAVAGSLVRVRDRVYGGARLSVYRAEG